MIKVEVQGIAEVQRKLAGMSRDMKAQVLQPALNKVAEKARAEINRAIPQEYAVKAAEVRNAITLRPAQSGRLEAMIEVFGSSRKKGRSLNLIHFLAAVQAAGRAVRARGAKVTKKDLATLDRQIGFLIKRAGGMKKIDGAFIGNKGRTVFKRVPGKQMQSRPGKLTKHSMAIEALQVVGFSQMFASRKISRRVMDKVNADLPVEVDRAIARMLSRL